MTRARALFPVLLILSSLVAAQAPAKLPSEAIPPERMQQYSELAVEWLQGYLRVNTTNPPGHESEATAYLKKILDAEGIENQVFEVTPGRTNLVARLRATSANPKRPLILLSHEDVVTSDPSRWKVPPFSGEIVEGVLYGRGAQDMKDEGLAQLVVMVMLKREKVALDRDVIFMATADEEAGDTGSAWMIKNKKDLFGNAEFLITEGGTNTMENGKAKFVGVEVGEKAPYWLHLVAHGTPGHASKPLKDSAPNHLVHALERVVNYQTPIRILPEVAEFFRVMAQFETGKRKAEFGDIEKSLQSDPKFRDEVTSDTSLNYMLRDTVSLTMLGGSQQTNVIPGEAWANLDVRLLPGTDPQAFVAQMKKVVADPTITVEPLGEFRPPNSSPTNTVLYDAIKKVAAHYFPGAPVAPHMDSGYTESQMYREVGIACYGFTPYLSTPEENHSEHGDNERIRVEEVRRGPRVLYDVVATVAGKQ